jgi:hypothetical protein
MDWYARMVKKYLRDSFFRTKSERLAIRDGKVRCIMQCT